MSNVIRFLESMGSNAALTQLSTGDYAALVASLDVDVPQREALLSRDQVALNTLLGGRAKMLCSLFPAEEEERRDDDSEVDKPDDEEEIEHPSPSQSGSAN